MMPAQHAANRSLGRMFRQQTACAQETKHLKIDEPLHNCSSFPFINVVCRKR